MKGGLTVFAVLSACSAARVPHRSNTAAIEVAYPQPISLERFEAMLQRATHLLRSPPQVVEPSAESEQDHIQLQRDWELNYHTPELQVEKTHKLDSKTQQMQYLMPPSEANQAMNFYMLKQKKIPKKFLHAAKQLNVKVIGEDEQEEFPRPMRAYSNHHNVIFDDSFFGLDAQAPVPEEIPQEHNNNHDFIAPLYSRRLRKAEDMFASSGAQRDARIRAAGVPLTRFSIVRY